MSARSRKTQVVKAATGPITRCARLAVACGLALATLGAAPEVSSDWPQWRGPLASGAAPAADPPATWAEGQNVRWKIKLPGRGTSTPIVCGDSVFIQTCIATGRKPDVAPPSTQPRRTAADNRWGIADPTELYQFVLICIDRRTGDTRWQQVAREVVPHEGHHKEHGFSSYSPVTDGQHVFAYFGSRGLHKFDMEGNIKWQKDLGRMETKNSFGEGSSPALLGDTIVINWDHQGADFIVALDTRTGDELWRTPREEDTSWATPLIVEHDGSAQVVTVATGRVRSYDLQTGKQVWEGPGVTANAIPTPVAGHGMVYATSGFRSSALYAVRLGASGDVTGTDAIVWSANKGTPYVPSPLLYGDRLYLFSGNNSILSCFDAKTGKPILDTERIDGLEGVYASPVGAGGRIYLVGRNGATVVIRHLDQSDKLEVLATNQLDDRFDSSPAIAGKDLFLRGQDHLYCIGAAQ